MCSKRPTDSVATGDHHLHHRRHRYRHDREFRTISKRASSMVKRTKSNNKLVFELDEEAAKKSLYVFSVETNGDYVAYVIRSIKLSDLLSSTYRRGDRLRLTEVAFMSGDHLHRGVGCGVFGSQIIIAGGLELVYSVTPGIRSGPKKVWHKNVYAFDLNDEDNKNGAKIRKLDATVQGPKRGAVMVELGGKLYALTNPRNSNDNPISFEVFDPKLGTWSVLPQPPVFDHSNHSYCIVGRCSYVFAGTKMFVSKEKTPVFCFDVAQPDREWRLVPMMCRDGGPLPFYGESLVMELPEQPEKKIVFGFNRDRGWYLAVYLLSLCENQESITLIGELEMPCLSIREFGIPCGCDFVHIGGGKVCIIVSSFILPWDEEPKQDNKQQRNESYAVCIPFEFKVVDMCKLLLMKEKDYYYYSNYNNCFTLQFMPKRIFQMSSGIYFCCVA